MISSCFEEKFNIALEKSKIWTKIEHIYLNDNNLFVKAKILDVKNKKNKKA